MKSLIGIIVLILAMLALCSCDSLQPLHKSLKDPTMLSGRDADLLGL